MAEGITGQSLAGLLDLDMQSIRKLSHAGIVVGWGSAAAIFWRRRSATMSGIYGGSRLVVLLDGGVFTLLLRGSLLCGAALQGTDWFHPGLLTRPTVSSSSSGLASVS
jgi:hypothetical protein